jgi:hypothetical protein
LSRWRTAHLRYTNEENGLVLRRYWTNSFLTFPLALDGSGLDGGVSPLAETFSHDQDPLQTNAM